ncbi:MAG: hypothetical protein WD273_05500 [Trueperaceae bacterium]
MLYELLLDAELTVLALRRLARSESPDDRRYAASDDRTPRDVLFELAGDLDEAVAHVSASTLRRVDERILGENLRSLLGIPSRLDEEVEPVESEDFDEEADASAFVEEIGATPLPAPTNLLDEVIDDFDQTLDYTAEAEVDLPAWNLDELRDDVDLFDLLDASTAETDSDLPVEESISTTDRAHLWAEQIMVQAGWLHGERALVRALDTQAIGPVAAAIRLAIRRGLVPEELELALDVREHWHAQFFEVAGGPISWKNTMKLIRGFDGYPDAVEIFALLEDAYQEYKWGSSRRIFRNFGAYIWHLLVDDWGGSNGNFDEHRFRLARSLR